MIRLAVIGLAAVISSAGCSTPPMTIQLAIQSAPPTCGSAVAPQCTDVPLACDAMLLIRVLDPNNPLQSFISTCQQVRPDNKHDLCAIASLDIPADAIPTNLPARTLEVQVVVLPLAFDANGDLDCASAVQNLSFSLFSGAPVSTGISPPIGGHAYYHPGDAVTVVELACNNLDALNLKSCVGSDDVMVTASVNEFDTQIAVSSGTANELTVSVGEPTPSGSSYVLNSTATERLDLNTMVTPPSWSAHVAAPTAFECLDVVDKAPGSTHTLSCKTVDHGAAALDFTGIHLSRERLAQIGAAVTADDPTFTLDHGLVIGIVLDAGSPVGNVPVSATSMTATVRYLSADGMSVTAGSATSANGIFISTDAPFDTGWSTLTATGFGGLVDEEVTVVVLQTTPPHP